MLFRIAVSPERLAWLPATFWIATGAELEMALEGLAGDYKAAPFISREEIRRLAVAHGTKPSLRSHPNVVSLSERQQKEL
ncbi:hypothetical protein ASD32_05085 [Rhizobium sp. Root483D2]|nr:hypothetical protein ASD32_05085 [Rhizobium sp. Root483D2]